jgi:HK97 family phage portal protein
MSRRRVNRRAPHPTITRAPRTTPKVVPGNQGYPGSASSAALTFQERGKVGKANVKVFRNWADHSEWIRAAIDTRKNQVAAAEWDIVPADMTKPFDETLRDQIRILFDNANPAIDSFRSFVEPVLEDILVLDAGIVEKVRDLRGQVGELWPVDGGTIRISATWDGDPEEKRYFWYPDNFERAAFKNRDMLYIKSHPRTHSVMGLSPLETLKLAIDAELSAASYNVRQVTNAAPDGMLDLGEGARPDQVEKFRSYFEAEVAGRGAMAFIGGTRGSKFVPFRGTNRDMQFLEWQTYLVRKICAVYQISPQDLGITFDINRANAEQQSQGTEDRGLRPLLSLISGYFTREVVWDMGFGGRANNLMFAFTQLNLRESTSKATVNKIALANVPWKTINEARIEEGRPPLGPGFDKLIMATSVGAVTLDDVLSAAEVMSGEPEPTDTAPQPSGKGQSVE